MEIRHACLIAVALLTGCAGMPNQIGVVVRHLAPPAPEVFISQPTGRYADVKTSDSWYIIPNAGFQVGDILELQVSGSPLEPKVKVLNHWSP
jgi:hypothetical protein